EVMGLLALMLLVESRRATRTTDSDAPSAAATDWCQILQLYDQLPAVAPNPVVALNRAVAVAEVAGPVAALAVVDDLSDSLGTGGYHLFHAVRADLLRRTGRHAEALVAYQAAIAGTE